MKVLATADWHIGPHKGPVENGVNVRYQDTVKCLDFMVEKAKEELPDLVCISGDIFDRELVGPDRYSNEMLTAVRIIEELAAFSGLVIVMRGTPNHDGTGQFSVLEKMLESNKKVFVVTVPQVIATPVADIACIPGFNKQEFRTQYPDIRAEEENIIWTQHISNIVMGLKAQCRDGVPSILMSHYTVPGANMESGQIAFFANFEPVIPREAIQAAGFDAVFLGHIHRPQRIEGLENVFYAGAVNALTFNDEGQDRGFWMHEFENGRLQKGSFVKTPYREFCTLRWDEEELTTYLEKGMDALFEWGIPFDVQDKIVRVQYRCTSDQKKALNVPVLRKELFELGAFYVADIEAESTLTVVNRDILSQESDPLLNLKKWLEEKHIEDAEKIVELAEPIISEAVSRSTTSDAQGVLRPVSIKVKNYRNYKEEYFDFEDITFCTINGVNGAGKSSLFMDAIMDCLFEETREGDKYAWIRATEDAKDGMIEFIFSIGTKRFRVVRKRAKTGKSSVNLSQLDENGMDWTNLSKERAAATQAEIEKVIGMDSMTFRSCALIMQDQYGLFLQAKKSDRLAILGNLLGLGLYDFMEQEAKKRLSNEKGRIAAKKNAVDVKKDFIKSKGNPEEELKGVELKLEESAAKKKGLSVELENVKKELSQIKEQTDKKNALLADVSTKSRKADELHKELQELKKQETVCDEFLKNKNLILENAKKAKDASWKVKELYPSVVRYDSEKENLVEMEREEGQLRIEISNMEGLALSKKQDIERLHNGMDQNIYEDIKRLDGARERLSEMRGKKDRYINIENEMNLHIKKINDCIGSRHTKLQLLKAELVSYEEQERFVANTGCVDIARADCQFLKRAKEDVAKISSVKDGIQELEALIHKYQEELDEYRGVKEKELSETGYDNSLEAELISQVDRLDECETVKRKQEEQKLQIVRLETECDSMLELIRKDKEKLDMVILRVEKSKKTVNELEAYITEYEKAVEAEEFYKFYIDKEKELPLMEERHKNITEKISVLDGELNVLVSSIRAGKDEMTMIEYRLIQSSISPEKVSALEEKISGIDEKTRELQMQKGSLIQRMEDIEKLELEISVLNKEIRVCAKNISYYDTLKQAFSQDGVPHQIIRNFIPHITDVANSILGAMTGGTMGVEFVLDKAVKSGEKATLDVLIDEYGKTSLPYASKSGGEKVKASLAVILALAEIKTSAAGIHLGMLFIDEPPFLDDDGTQAYVDSLETIRNRYADVKIMAITHDDAMKARFPQSLTVVKTDEGSKVMY